ncbi:MAG TPA: hypothetical protein PK867_26135 [Pirellulales bacterium]|nr:hypothetical protein [Pirellulales bacterium]
MSSRRTRSCRLVLPAIVLPAIFAAGHCAAAEPAVAPERSYVVRRPVIETSSREEQYVLYEPVTTFVPQQVDQGAWVDQQVVRPGRTSIELRWMSGGWTVDPATGREYWQLPMLRPVRVRRPDTMEVVRVWKPNMVTLSVPKVSYQPRLHTRQVPVQTLRMIDERRVRRWPCPCGPATVPSAPAAGPAVPVDSPPAFPAPLPLLPQPNIDPLEKVPEPATLSPNKTGEQSGPAQWRDAQQDRVASRKEHGNGLVGLQPRNRAA